MALIRFMMNKGISSKFSLTGNFKISSILPNIQFVRRYNATILTDDLKRKANL